LIAALLGLSQAQTKASSRSNFSKSILLTPRSLWPQPLDGSPGHKVTNFQGDTLQYHSFSLDGKTLMVMRSQIESDVILLHDTGSSPQ
jgi:hypothetical protein